MKLNAEGLALIAHFEGFRAAAYRCPAGVWTIGYGHTSAAGPPPVKPGMRVNEAEAARILAADAGRVAVAVRAELKREVSEWQFSALVSFAFNIGIGAFRRSSVLRCVNAGDLSAVPGRLGLWVKASGQVLPGLVRRRKAEAQFFMKKEMT